jgi:hypothetical protein
MSKFGALGRGIAALTALLTKLSYKFLINVAFMFSLGISVYTVADYTRIFLKDKKPILDIIYWRDPKKSGIVLGAIFVILFLVAKFSFILIGTYSALLILICTLGFRIFKLAEAKFKKTEDKNPFQPMLEKELDVPQEKIHAQVDVLVENVRNIALQLRRLFFVESVVDSVKFFFLLYSLTYIGSWFSGFALIILFVIGVFTVPKVYEMNKEPIDNYLHLAKENVDKLHQTVGEKVPFLNTSATVPPVTKKEE